MEKKKNLNIIINMIQRTAELQKTLLKSIMDIDEQYYVSDNIVHAENAFLINSILSWYFKEHAQEKINITQISSFLDLLEKHVQGELILGWDKKGNIQMRKKKQQGLNKTEEP